MSGFIGIDVRGIPELQAKLAKLPDAVQDMAIDEVADYLLNVLKQYPPPNYVTRARAYGQTFQSAKQRKWFFWALDNGFINVPYRRTQGLARGWKKLGKGRDALLANETEAAQFTMGDGTQSRHEKLVGWKTLSVIIGERSAEIRRRAEAGVKKGIKKAGL